MANALKDKLVKVLVENKVLTQAKLDEALQVQAKTKEPIGDILVKLNYVTSDNLLEVVSAELNIPAIHLSRYKIDPEVLRLVSRKTCELYCLIPVSKFGNTLTLAVSDPQNLNALDAVKQMTGTEVRWLLAGEKDILDTIAKVYAATPQPPPLKSDSTATLSRPKPVPVVSVDEATQEQLAAMVGDQPVVKLTNLIMADGVRLKASDIFIEHEEKTFRVRYRVDGLLQAGLTDKREMHAAIVSRVKVMSNLDIAEHRVPQDGRFKMQLGAGEVDFRVSVLPSYYGEKVVLRVLDKNQNILDIEKLGFEPEPMRDLKKAAGHPHGMIVVCGPTGSGKTTTLYSLIKMIDSPEKNIVTVEDPVEFQMEGINQVAIRPEVKLNFASALRSILRQDPNVIMVGEIRDAETADVAIKAALTGHLVLSTLHATTAAGAVTRFLNMGIEPFLITSSMLLAGSQRLVRKICEKCKESYEPAKELLVDMGIPHKAGQKVLFYRGRGCDACRQKGYAGRAVLLESMTMTPTVKQMILKSEPEYKLKAVARKEGMKTLRENGIAKILAGVTTPEEVMRVTVKDSEPEP